MGFSYKPGFHMIATQSQNRAIQPGLASLDKRLFSVFMIKPLFIGLNLPIVLLQDTKLYSDTIFFPQMPELEKVSIHI